MLTKKGFKLSRASTVARSIVEKAVNDLKKVKTQKKQKKEKFTLEDTPLIEASNYLQEAIATELKPIYVMLRAFQHYYV